MYRGKLHTFQLFAGDAPAWLKPAATSKLCSKGYIYMLTYLSSSLLRLARHGDHADWPGGRPDAAWDDLEASARDVYEKSRCVG